MTPVAEGDPGEGGRPGVDAGGGVAGAGDDPTGTRSPSAAPATRYGRTWVFESVFGALPGVAVSSRLAVGLQLLSFEAAVLGLAWLYDLPGAVLVGTAAVGLAALGSAQMLRIGGLVRSAAPPESYERLLFGSKVEIVLGVLAFLAVVTHLFVFDPRGTGEPLVAALFGPDPPVPVVYVALLVLWDVAYRIGTNWWAAVVGLWRAVRYRAVPGADGAFRFSPARARTLRRADLETMAFGLVQLAIAPLLLDRPVLLAVLLAHVGAVVVVTGTAAALMTPGVGGGADPEDGA